MRRRNAGSPPGPPPHAPLLPPPQQPGRGTLLRALAIAILLLEAVAANNQLAAAHVDAAAQVNIVAAQVDTAARGDAAAASRSHGLHGPPRAQASRQWLTTAAAVGTSAPAPAGMATATGSAASLLDVERLGLVSQWDDAFYGRALADPAASGRLLLAPGLLWAAAERDAAAADEAPAEYVARVRGRVAAFLGTTEADGLPRVINHDGTRAALRVVGGDDGKGLLMLLTGPRSVGKSLMLEKTAKELARQQRRVVYIDARQHGPDLTRGIIAALVKDPSFFEKVQQCASGPVAKGMLAMASELVTQAALRQRAALVGALVYIGELLKPAALAASPRLDDVLGAFITACGRDGEYPVIFIDEADEAFKAAQVDAAATARVLAELNLFTRVTKQKREVSVVLATSEHRLPLRLRALGYNTDHISETIVAEEVPPAVMKDELMRGWGCGEHLATALLSMYGGHVLHASAAVRKLAVSAAPASMEGSAALGSIVSAPALCLDSDTLAAAGVPEPEWPGMRERVTGALRALVETGSVPLESEKDKVAEVISQANVGCVIPRAAAASGVPPGAWLARTPSGEEPKFILVPSSHIMRLLIASKVFPPPLPRG